jgi:L-iditol 2-dehydrogenase
MSQSTTQFDPASIASDSVGSMLAGVYRGKDQVVVESVPIPEIQDGELLFRVAACGICGTDTKKIHHGFIQAPQILGHEFGGTVVKVGRNVTKFKPGDRVVAFHHIPCSDCFYCRHKLFSQCEGYKKVGLTGGFQPNGGGFAQYVRAMPWIIERGMLAIPPDITFEEATFIEPVNTALKAVRKARVARDENIVIIGQGPIGMLLTMISKHEGARIFTSDPMAARRQASLRFGAVEAFDPADGALVDKIRQRTEGRGADAVLLAAPNASLVPEALAMARPGGRILLFAHNDPVLQLEFPAAAVGIEEKEILGSYSASVDDQEEAAALVFNRTLPVADMVSHRFPLERIAEALELAARPTGDTLKVLISHE